MTEPWAEFLSLVLTVEQAVAAFAEAVNHCRIFIMLLRSTVLAPLIILKAGDALIPIIVLEIPVTFRNRTAIQWLINCMVGAPDCVKGFFNVPVTVTSVRSGTG